MGKWYSHNLYIKYTNDLKVDRGFKIETFLPHVITIARTFPQNNRAIGILELNDLIQAGNIGLTEAWQKIDWSRIETSPNPNGELWSFLKIRIKFAIRQEINRVSNIVKIPERLLRDASKNMKPHEKVLVNVFPQFFDEELWVEPHIVEPWISIQLEDLIIKELTEVEGSYDNIDILLRFYGIGFKEMTQKELAEKYMKTPANIQKIIQRTKDKLRNDNFEKTIENFYKNESYFSFSY